MGSGAGGWRGGWPDGRRAALAVLAAGLLMLVVGSAGSSADSPNDVTVSAEPRWGEVAPGSWTPYSVTVRNDGGHDLRGEVVLTPQPEPAPKPGAPPSTTATTSSPPTVLVEAKRVLTSPPPRGAGARTALPQWPSYRVPVSVPLGSVKSVTVLVMQAPSGFGVQLVDEGGLVLAGAPGPVPPAREHVNVLLLSDSADADNRLHALRQLVAPNLHATQLLRARDFPDVALHLTGLDAVVIDDFETAALSDRQHQALVDYVSLGGSLVLTGGAAWSRTLGSLPPDLPPLRASGSGPAPMSPLADLWASTTTATAEVASGEVRAGRVVLSAPGGPPLVVVSDYHQGRVVQLTYDPLAEPIASDQVLHGVAWDQALARVAPRWGRNMPRPAAVAEDQLWASSLDLGARPWPARPRWSVPLLLGYALLVGLTAFLSARRARLVAGGATIVLAVLVATTAELSIASSPDQTVDAVVEVRTAGADGAVLTTAYRGVLDLTPPDRFSVPSGGASTVFTARPVFSPVEGYVDAKLTRTVPNLVQVVTAPVARGFGGGAVLAESARPAVRLAPRPWELRTVQTVSIERGGPALEVNLRRDGLAGTAPGRVKGTITNRGEKPVRQLQAQIQQLEGKPLVAHLAEVVGPGETMQVDAPLLSVTGTTPGRGPIPPEDVVEFAASHLAVTGRGQVAVAGLADPVTPSTAGAHGKRSGVGVVVTVGLLESDSFLSDSGKARLTSASPFTGGRDIAIADLETSTGAGPLSIQYLFTPEAPGAGPGPASEVYSWTAGTWRALPVNQPGFAGGIAPLQASEVSNGLVRFRTRGVNPIFSAGNAALVPTTAGLRDLQR